MGASCTRVDEKCTDHAKKIPLSIANKVSKSICKINYILNDEKVNGTGFFMIANKQKYIIICYHVLGKDLNNLDINIIIEIYNKKTKNIKLSNRDYEFFKKIDITLIEIKESDKILKDINFLDYDSNFSKGYDQYINTDIFTLQYPKDEIEIASGKILEIIDNFEFKHSIDTDYGSSGSPIILPNILKVIGIHKQGDRCENFKYCSFIGEII